MIGVEVTLIRYLIWRHLGRAGMKPCGSHRVHRLRRTACRATQHLASDLLQSENREELS